MPRRIILDCDPGHDDAIAILLAAGSPNIDLVGITTVAGNQTLEKTTRNARVVATIAGLHNLPIVAGCDRPLLRRLRTAAEYHGDSGLDGPEPVTPTVPLASGHAVDFLIDSVMAAPGELTIVATGPLTNLAIALRKQPEMVEAAREVVIMGGAHGTGNVTPAAEFNIFVDPEAAAVVFEAPWTVTMMGLNLTHQAICTEDTQRAIASIGTPAARFANSLLTFFRESCRKAAGMVDPPVHDACAVGYVANPDLFETRSANVEIELYGTATTGMTVVDFKPSDGPERRIGVSLDAPAFWDAVIDAIARIA
jgi:purine nucleosidase